MIFIFNKHTRGRMDYEQPQRTCLRNVQNAVNCTVNNWQACIFGLNLSVFLNCAKLWQNMDITGHKMQFCVLAYTAFLF
jgi:hypothetical protein